MPYLDESVWQEIAKWFLGIAAFLAASYLALLRLWLGSRFKVMSERLDDHDLAIQDHDEQLAHHHETVQIVMVHIENGKKDRDRIEGVIVRMDEKLDRLVERS